MNCIDFFHVEQALHTVLHFYDFKNLLYVGDSQTYISKLDLSLCQSSPNIS